MVRMFLVVAALGGSLALAAGGDGHEGGGMAGDGMMDGRMGDHDGAGTEGAAAGGHDGAGTGGHDGADDTGDRPPSSYAYMRAMQDMDRAMTEAPMTGDADIDFARMMIAHHEGAIDMAEVVLSYGDDPEIRDMALRVVTDQTKEIAELERWLESRTR